MSFEKTPLKIKNFFKFGLTPDEQEDFIVRCIEDNNLDKVKSRIAKLLIKNNISLSEDVIYWLNMENRTYRLYEDICKICYPSTRARNTW
jgi:hypothetical protein